MNLVDAYVEEIISEPFMLYDKWWVKVKAKSYGSSFETSLMFNDRESCNISVGYEFNCQL